MIDFYMEGWRPVRGEEVYLSHPVTGNKFIRVTISEWDAGCFYITFRDLVNYHVHARHCSMKPIVHIPICTIHRIFNTKVGQQIHYAPRNSEYLVVGDGVSKDNGVWVPAWSYISLGGDGQYYTKPKDQMWNDNWSVSDI